MRSAEEIQREQVQQKKALIHLHAACTVGNGILRLDHERQRELLEMFENLEGRPAFFIPASGSGSRMFQFLFEWSEHFNEDEDVQEIIDKMSSLAAVKEYLAEADSVFDLTKILLKNVASKPKGLIPFHTVDGKVYTAFQEHALQVKRLFPEGAHIHFTVQRNFEEAIRENLTEIQHEIEGLEISYSQQSIESDAFCFDGRGRRVDDENRPLRKPAGHGALLENLNNLPYDLVCIKNIDNVQHYNKSVASTAVWKTAVGLVLDFQKEMRTLASAPTLENLRSLNARFDFLSEAELEQGDEAFIQHIFQRPTRVCGMVRNEGEPGGGPFWVNDNGRVTKQIVEKVQISECDDQQEIVAGSSHFNPVFMVVSKSDIYGNSLDLLKFRDDSKYFVVHKSHKGKDIWFRELPGLWNGGMSDWNTLFLEIPSEVFSPVKTILDLAKPLHQP